MINFGFSKIVVVVNLRLNCLPGVLSWDLGLSNIFDYLEENYGKRHFGFSEILPEVDISDSICDAFRILFWISISETICDLFRMVSWIFTVC